MWSLWCKSNLCGPVNYNYSNIHVWDYTWITTNPTPITSRQWVHEQRSISLKSFYLIFKAESQYSYSVQCQMYCYHVWPTLTHWHTFLGQWQLRVNSVCRSAWLHHFYIISWRNHSYTHARWLMLHLQHQNLHCWTPLVQVSEMGISQLSSGASCALFFPTYLLPTTICVNFCSPW